MVWRYDETHHRWWDDETTYNETRFQLGYPAEAPSGEIPDPAAGAGLVSDFYADPARYVEPQNLDALREALAPLQGRPDGLYELRPGAPEVEQTLPFPAPPPPQPAPEPLSLEEFRAAFERAVDAKIAEVDSGLRTALTREDESGVAATANEQDHSNPWRYAGEEASAPGGAA